MTSPLALWGGIECSVVRLGGLWRDQSRETGHHERLDDLDRVAALGIRTLRYPVLWERCEAGPVHCGWEWHDERMARLRELGISPIIGLMHHGSGPPGTSLLDAELPERLAAHAARVAARYPWIMAWTPVNEPLTTARFSGLYGLWYPHECDEERFLVMLAIQCRAVLLAMRAIRRRIPGARLVQTEDLSRVFSTRRLAYQAEYENGRRWLSLDLLHGRVDRAHPWRERFTGAGIPAAWLDEFLAGEAAPDITGINHYASSDRFLDHRLMLYPHLSRGGNDRDIYVDTEAVRADLPVEGLGWKARLREAWRRYRRPLAITEAHLGCEDVAEQLRWLMEAWNAARELRAEGADLRAVTAWALFGAMDWNSMLTKRDGHYEAGAWDISDGQPRPTLLAQAIEALAKTGRFTHPALAEPGWWRREDRLHPALRTAS